MRLDEETLAEMLRKESWLFDPNATGPLTL